VVATSCRVIESVRRGYRPLSAQDALTGPGHRPFVEFGRTAARSATGRGSPFDSRGVRVRPRLTRARIAVATAIAGWRAPAGGEPPEPYGRRELTTELAIVAAFGLAAVAAALKLPTDGVPAGQAIILGALLVVMLVVEFDVMEGRTSPVQLVFVPMLVLVPPGYVALLAAGAHAVRALGPVLRGGRPPLSVLLAVGDAWYSIGPALVIGLTAAGPPSSDTVWIYAVALGAQIAVDFAVTAVRLRVGLGIRLRPELQAMAWVYLVDAMLMPIGVLAALAARATVGAVTLILPLAALLVVFARERRGRIENALALGRVAEENERRLQSLVQHASDLIVIAEPDGTMRNLTGAARQIFGEDWSSMPGTRLQDHAHPADHSVIRALLSAATRKPHGESSEAEWRMLRADGSWRHVEGIATNLLAQEHVEAVVVTVRDVHERHAFEEELRHRAFHDGLTGLPNRALFYDRLEHALGGRGDRLVGVVFVDLDDFKAVNDRLGHAAGDDLLVEFAARLRSCVRASDTAARLAGDEFGVLLEDVAGPNEPIQVAERILAALAEPLSGAGGPQTVTPSIGIVVSTLQDDAPEELLRRADVAMYAAKAGGKGRWELYQPEFEGDPDDAERGTGDVRWATRTDEQREQILSVLDRPQALRIVFQPIIDLRTGDIAGYEALSRFDGAVDQPPNAWFEQAHRCGLGYRLEALALERALKAPDRPAGVYLTVNLSLSTLASDEVQAVLPARLDGVVIEITENELVTDKADVLAAMTLVRERGARLAVDDAGSGYAGLQHVMRLEPDVIKLDRTLVDGVAADPVKAALIEAFVRYARRIDATICAEGIETLADLDVLADIDVAFGQGWAIGRPAAPWAPVSDAAAAACRRRVTAMLAGSGEASARDALEQVADALSDITAHDRVELALAPFVRELRGSRAAVYRRCGDRLVALGAETWLDDDDAAALDGPLLAGRAVQIVEGARGNDASARAALRARGAATLLAVPIVADGRTVGALEVWAGVARPWSRHDVHRARLVAHQLRETIALQRDHAFATAVTAAPVA
jgi:diguanylate cyclase (GGDEF)-like protein/PAS domain S-box-containing protein